MEPHWGLRSGDRQESRSHGGQLLVRRGGGVAGWANWNKPEGRPQQERGSPVREMGLSQLCWGELRVPSQDSKTGSRQCLRDVCGTCPCVGRTDQARQAEFHLLHFSTFHGQGVFADRLGEVEAQPKGRPPLQPSRPPYRDQPASLTAPRVRPRVLGLLQRTPSSTLSYPLAPRRLAPPLRSQLHGHPGRRRPALAQSRVVLPCSKLESQLMLGILWPRWGSEVSSGSDPQRWPLGSPGQERGRGSPLGLEPRVVASNGDDRATAHSPCGRRF